MTTQCCSYRETHITNLLRNATARSCHTPSDKSSSGKLLNDATTRAIYLCPCDKLFRPTASNTSPSNLPRRSGLLGIPLTESPIDGCYKSFDMTFIDSTCVTFNTSASFMISDSTQTAKEISFAMKSSVDI